MSLISGKVAAIMNERELVINRGAAHGVKVDMVFQVMDVPVAVIDPETKEPLGTVSREKIRVKVTKVEPRYAVARTFETYQVNEGGPGTVDFTSIFRPKQIVTK